MNKKFTDADIENDPQFKKFVNKKKGRKEEIGKNIGSFFQILKSN